MERQLNRNPNEDAATASHPLERGPLLAVFAHPDDETFAVGGTLARYAAAGVKVVVLTATHGERSTLGTSARYTPEALGRVREGELRAAATHLGIATVRVLEYCDGTLGGIPADVLAAQIFGVLREVRPAVVVTFDEGGVTGHPDHIAISRATTQAFACIGDAWPARLFYWTLPESTARAIEQMTGACWVATPDERVTVALDVGEYLAVQREAIACHRTQCEPLPLPLTARLAAQNGHEYYVLAASTLPGDHLEAADLYG